MKHLQTFKYELQPNSEQARFVFNKALAMQKAIDESGEKKSGYAGLCKELTAWKAQPETW